MRKVSDTPVYILSIFYTGNTESQIYWRNVLLEKIAPLGASVNDEATEVSGFRPKTYCYVLRIIEQHPFKVTAHFEGDEIPVEMQQAMCM